MLFLKNNQILPIFDQNALNQSPFIHSKIQSYEEHKNVLKLGSNRSVGILPLESEKTNVISLGEKMQKESPGVRKEGYSRESAAFYDESSQNETKISKIRLDFFVLWNKLGF